MVQTDSKVVVLGMALLMAGCAQIKTYEQVEQTKNAQLYTHLGGTVVKVQKTSDLPNIYGKADIWGGKVDEGFTELRYEGLNDDGTVTLSVSEISVLTNEDVFSRYVGTSHAHRVTLPPSVRMFKFDYVNNQELIIGNTAIRIIQATPTNLEYFLTDIR